MTDKSKNYSYGITKQEHDEIVAKKNRPLTQTPIQKKNIDGVYDPMRHNSFIDKFINSIRKENPDDNS